MNCKEITVSDVCFVDAAGTSQSLNAHYQYGLNAADAVLLEATYFTDASGVVVDTRGGTVSVGSCSTRFKKFVEYGCLLDSTTGLKREIEILKTLDTVTDLVSVTYHEVEGERIFTLAADTVSLGKCYHTCATCR